MQSPCQWIGIYREKQYHLYMQNEFTYCPRCGGKKIQYIDGRKWSCGDCGFRLYSNVAAAVGLIITAENGNVLFEIRAKEPRKGYLAIPGGFCNPDETAEQAALRECKEETGIQPDSLEYLCSFPNTYDYKDIRYKTCDLFFIAGIGKSEGKTLLSRLAPQLSEVSGFVTRTISSGTDIEELALGFESTRKALYRWLEKRKRNG
jgi:ADP-ribose pyrophosphatase YjhB (NUDIX family)